MKPTVYVETTVISYLAAWPSRDLIRAAHQRITREWWDGPRMNFDLYISQAVLKEAGEGDPVAANDRFKEIREIPLLETPVEAEQIALRLIAGAKLPKKAQTDALHIALAAFHGIEFLLTWNCRHINNVEFRSAFEKVCAKEELICPRICTPEELLGESAYED